MLAFGENTLDTWLADFEAFNYDFKRHFFETFQAVGVAAVFDDEVLKQAHTNWVSSVESWLRDHSDENTASLSAMKSASLLLFCLCEKSILTSAELHEYASVPSTVFTGSDEDKQMVIDDILIDGQYTLPFDFCILIIDWYERNRDDRETEYRQPLTFDMRHDILTYLRIEEVQKRALYLILKGVYLRPNNGGSKN